MAYELKKNISTYSRRVIHSRSPSSYFTSAFQNDVYNYVDTQVYIFVCMQDMNTYHIGIKLTYGLVRVVSIMHSPNE